MSGLRLFFVLVLLFCSACAINEGPTPTPRPPLVLPPAPTVTIAGDCNNSRDLANWLQFTEYHLGEFQSLVTSAATQSDAEMYESVLLMGRMRDTISATAAPDCAEPTQRLAVATISRVIDGFQARVNGDSVDMTALVAGTLAQFDQITLTYAELNDRLETQLQAQTSSDNPG